MFDLSAQLRRAPLDEAEEREAERFVVKRWVERAAHTLKLWAAHPSNARVACEVLIAWQALERFAPDAPLEERRAAVLAELTAVVEEHGAALVELGARSFALEEWERGLEAYEAALGVPTSWDEKDAASARALIEDLDNALLFEAAAEVLDVPLPDDLAEALQRCAERGAAAAHSLIPAQVFIRALAATLDPTMRAASGTYALWLALMEAREAWALGEVFVRAAVDLHERAHAKPQAEIIDFAERLRSKLASYEASPQEKIDPPEEQHAAAADSGDMPARRLRWKGPSWRAWLDMPSPRKADDEPIELFLEESLPCDGAVFLWGVGRVVKSDAFSVIFTLRDLRAGDKTLPALVFVGEDGRVEVGRLVEDET
jgi:hypothetical protein